MNEKFFSLPAEKQTAILNAGYRVFSQNTYKKSPMQEIADAAGISKSLLFHYFRNKKELYLYLWETSAQITLDALNRCGCYDQQDLFDAMYVGMKAKGCIMRQYPNLSNFVMKAYYEKDPAVCQELQQSIAKFADFRENAKQLRLSPEQFLPGIDLQMMYQNLYWATEGYLWEKLQQGALDAEEMERDFTRMITFWKSIYLRKETADEGH